MRVYEAPSRAGEGESVVGEGGRGEGGDGQWGGEGERGRRPTWLYLV